MNRFTVFCDDARTARLVWAGQAPSYDCDAHLCIEHMGRAGLASRLTAAPVHRPLLLTSVAGVSLALAFLGAAFHLLQGSAPAVDPIGSSCGASPPDCTACLRQGWVPGNASPRLSLFIDSPGNAQQTPVYCQVAGLGCRCCASNNMTGP